MTTYYSFGKLLITGEYLILDGAESICIPTKKGQSLSIEKTEDQLLTWKSYDINNIVWFECQLNSSSLKTLQTSDQIKSDFLITILRAAFVLNPEAKNTLKNGVKVETRLDFDTTWGLGSSSTLLCNISKWLNVNAFQLHFKTTNGSGYDIACGLSDFPLLYKIKDQKPTFHKIEFDPIFKERLFFIHLNQKQISSKEVATYHIQKNTSTLSESVKEINSISKQLLRCQTLIEFETLLNLHELITANALNKRTIKELLFSEYSGGSVKSLGAWGGDFVLVTTSKPADLDYFKNKGYTTIINWNEMFI